MFLGYSYGYKGVLCYNVLTYKILVSRNIIYDETFFSYLNLVRTSTSSQSCSSTSTHLRPIVVQLSTSASQSHVPAHSNLIGSCSSLSNTIVFSISQSSNVQESASLVHLNNSNATFSTSPAMLHVFDSG